MFHERMAAAADVLGHSASFAYRPDTVPEDAAQIPWPSPEGGVDCQRIPFDAQKELMATGVTQVFAV
jgi:hypothetical protein